ncbi:MAG: hypothetical protein H0W06_02835 [Chloroflexia bacterium]|nr:hypothetical protein [Chloroflexia bacterium]
MDMGHDTWIDRGELSGSIGERHINGFNLHLEVRIHGAFGCAFVESCVLAIDQALDVIDQCARAIHLSGVVSQPVDRSYAPSGENERDKQQDVVGIAPIALSGSR